MQLVEELTVLGGTFLCKSDLYMCTNNRASSIFWQYLPVPMYVQLFHQQEIMFSKTKS